MMVRNDFVWRGRGGGKRDLVRRIAGRRRERPRGLEDDRRVGDDGRVASRFSVAFPLLVSDSDLALPERLREGFKENESCFARGFFTRVAIETR